ncbi:Bug family tripartite tricarboxylate transporter substrate binding protein [Aquabacterium sp. J223]|uniref:Bug family tripartite tricarboxylate transporter substrate binding protein n=1 Tax=Aquabacterium sp. J223 TaxID=2898431 RepID=UPI0021AE050A|nr:tripartite tricarboxylate transporter substrate binding protein [Aquabacterium sp. J223]UUX95056.1 tripartite tricarboxylate transporter substrate binding protein [Aquabacterium sp. J223]
MALARATRRALLLSTLAGVPALGAAATPYPSRPLRLVVPYAAGGGTDALARALAEAMSPALGQPVVVENRTGAAGLVGTEHVAKAAPDGHTLLMGLSDALLVAPFLHRKLAFDPRRDLALVSLVASGPMVLVTSPGLPALSGKAFADYLSARRGRLSYGSWGVGSFPHLAGLHLSQTLDADMAHLPYRGEAPMVQDLLGGQVHLAYAGLRISKPYIDAGRLRAVGLTGERRLAVAPGIPTLLEQGLNDLPHRLTVWLGLAAPAGTPADVVERLSALARDACQQPAVQQRIAELGCEVRATTPQAFAAAYDQEAPLWAQLVRASGVQLD